jgi:hypothetical protein
MSSGGFEYYLYCNLMVLYQGAGYHMGCSVTAVLSLSYFCFLVSGCIAQIDLRTSVSGEIRRHYNLYINSDMLNLNLDIHILHYASFVYRILNQNCFPAT